MLGRLDGALHFHHFVSARSGEPFGVHCWDDQDMSIKGGDDSLVEMLQVAVLPSEKSLLSWPRDRIDGVPTGIASTTSSARREV